LNVAPGELSDYKKNCKLGKVERLTGYQGLAKTEKNSAVVVEDIINMTKKDEQHLRQSLNYDAHHKSQKLFCISHSIYKTSLYSTLSFFHYIIFTSAAANVPVLRFTLAYFKIEKSRIESWIVRFTRKCKALGRKRFAHFVFDCSQMKFWMADKLGEEGQKLRLIGSMDAGDGDLEGGETVSNADSITPRQKKRLKKYRNADEGSSSSDDTDVTDDDDDDDEIEEDLLRIASLKKRMEDVFSRLMEGHPSKSQAAAVFSIILSCLSVSHVREQDLTVCFKLKTSGRTIIISLVDYIASMLDPTPAENQPDPSLFALHKFIRTLCYVPKLFIKNKQFH
jgi:hypothetical protein